MKRFIFSLAAVLRSKEIFERMRVRELAAAQALYLSEQQKWESLVRQQDHTAALVAEKAKRNMRASEACAWREHLLTLGDQVAAQQVKIQQIEQVVRKKTDEVVIATREKKILECLRQKQFDAYQFELNRALQKEIDEVAQRRHWQDSF